MADKVIKAVKSPLEKVDQQAEEKLFGNVRADMAKRPHFVPIQLGNVDIVQTTLERFIQFPKREQDALVNEYKDRMQALYDKQIEKNEKTGELKLKAGIKPKAGYSVSEQIRRIADDTIGSALGLIVFDFSDLKRELIAFLKERHSGRIILSAANGWSVRGKSLNAVELKKFLALHPCIVYLDTEVDQNIIGALYSSFGAAGSGLFTPFFNKKLATAKKFSTSSVPSTQIPSLLQLSDEYVEQISLAQEKAAAEIRKTLGVDIGHLAGTSKSLQTILQQKINEIRNWMQGDGKKLLTPEQIAKYNVELANASQKLLEQLRGDGTATYGELIQSKLVELKILSRLEEVDIVVVIPQERYENQYFAGRKIEYVIAQDLAKVIPEYKQSPSLIDRITTVIADILENGTSKLSNYNKVTKLQIKIPGIKRKLNPIKVTVGDKQGKITSGKLAKPREIKPKAVVYLPTSPIDIQNIINASLAETIKQNMGSGNRRDILNLRTGRFAESVQAQRVSQSRQGMISVFYSYMRNPYATFSRGGQQERPTSRDPKLLISRSIRQIAAELMITNLRSINT